MKEANSSRRRFVALGVSAGVTALAGCGGGSDDGSNSGSGGGGGGGSVVLQVGDQSGDGSSVSVEQASAPVDFYVDVHADTTGGISDTFEAGTTLTDVDVGLDPVLQTDAMLEVTIHNATNDEHIGDRAMIQYTVSG